MKNRIVKSIRAKGTIAAIIILCTSCILSFLITMFVFWGSIKLGIVTEFTHASMGLFSLVALILSALIGSLLLFLALNRITKPIIHISDCAKKVTSGDFSVRVKHTSKDEIGTLADNFNSMVDGLSKMEYLRKDFMSSVSHEFKTPIAAIQGFAELISDDNTMFDERLEYSRILKEETTRLSKLCSNMLRLSGLDSGTMVLKPVRFSLDEQIRKVIVLLADLWQEKNLTIDTDLEKIDFYGDEELLHQVWLNLLDNAIKFSEKSGNVSVSCAKAGEFAVVCINNMGKIIDEQNKERIFEKFYQCDKSHSQSGNGLGLSIVKRIVDISGGEISFESSTQNGTTFKVIIK